MRKKWIYWPRIWLTFARCLLVVEVLGLLELASSNGLFKVGKASLFNRRRNASLHSMRSRNCGECPGSYASSVKCHEQILLHDEGLNSLRLQNSIHTFLLRCWAADFPLGNEKKLIPLGFFWLSLLQPYTGQYMLQLWLACKWNPAKLHSHLYSVYS